MKQLRRSRRWILALSLLAMVACAGRSAGSGASPRRYDRLTEAEIAQLQPDNMLRVLQALRPNWLLGIQRHSLSEPSAGQVIVYLDGTRAGGTDILRQILSSQVQSAQFLTGSAASARFGLDHTGGAILLVTRRP